jgi:hypothetical protein
MPVPVPTPQTPPSFTIRLFKALGRGGWALAAVLWRYLVATAWLLVFWIGLQVLCGVVVGFQAGMHAGSRADAIRAGGMAAIRFGSSHDRLLLFLSGLCVAMGLSGGRLPGARRKSPYRKEVLDRIASIRRDALDRFEAMKRLEPGLARPKKSALAGK